MGCGFKCEYLDEFGECEVVGTECVGDMCGNWNECDCCTREEACKE